MPARYFIHLAYNGQRYHGWQVQPNAVTVQQVLAQSLGHLLGQPVEVTGCGRTDTGVHASSFYAHIEYDGPRDMGEVAFRINRALPPDIVVYAIAEVVEDAHARFSATARTYNYKVCTRKNPFRQQSHWLVDRPLGVAAMNKAAAVFLHVTDFTSFSKTGTQVKTNNCDVRHAEWQQHDDELIFTVTADRFLRNMVRAMVGTLVDVGLGKSTPAEVRQILEAKNRGAAGTSVPAHGLYLTEVRYPAHIEQQLKKPCRRLQEKH